MKVIGFNFTKSDFRYCVLQSTTDQPLVIDKSKIIYPISMDVPSLMSWFETQLLLIINKVKADAVAHKISMNLTSLDQIRTSCYPQAILSLVCNKQGIPVGSYSSQAINATKFGQPKKVDVYTCLDSLIGSHPPYWDKGTKDAALVAFFKLLNK